MLLPWLAPCGERVQRDREGALCLEVAVKGSSHAPKRGILGIFHPQTEEK